MSSRKNARQWVFCVAKPAEVDVRSFLQLLSIFFEIEFLPGTQRAPNLARVTDQCVPGILLSLPPQHCDYWWVLLCLMFYVSSGDWTQILLLKQQILYE